MTEPYQAIIELLMMLSATEANKTLSRDRKLSSKVVEKVTRQDLVRLQRIIDIWNDYHVITAIQNLEYLVPLLTEFQRLLKKERMYRDERTRAK
jgi:hypothetical protein